MTQFKQFFPDGFDASKYAIRPQSDEPPSVAAWQHLTELGYKPPFLQQGKLMRFPDAYDLAKGDKRGQGGWCIYNEHGKLGVLTFGSWHEGEKNTWSNISQDYMDTDQRKAFMDAIDAARRIRDDEDRREKENAQARFLDTWEKLSDANDSHPYLVKKSVKPHGIKQQGDKLIIPMCNHDKILGLQEIDKDGAKKFVRHSTKGFFIIGEIKDRLFVAEGYSTGASIHEATGEAVAIAFDAGNLFPVCSALKELYRDKDIIICADDDKHGAVNTGLDKAKIAGDSLGLRVIAPKTEGTDFNDMAAEVGLEAVADYINSALEIKQPRKTKADKKEDAQRPHGAMGLIYDYYMATSGYEQRGFAVQTAIAIASVVCARNYRTDNDNYSSVFLLNVGKTATGKEHCKTLINKVLRSANMDGLVIGDGFTSAGGVMTELLRKPRCASVIDEFGMYLEASSAKGNSNQKEANSALMQALGRVHDVFLAKNYSAMTVKEKEINDRRVYNPALTLVGITTPSTFFDSISSKDIHSGFLNRFIVSISDVQIGLRKKVAPFDVPSEITNWLYEIQKRAQKKTPIEVSAEPSNAIEIAISKPAWDIHLSFEQEMVDLMIKYEPIKMEGIFGRAAEMAHRLALIAALSRDAQTEIVADVDMKWACDYVRARYMQLFDAARDNLSENQFERDCQEIVEFIESNGMQASKNELHKKFRKHSTRVMEEMLKTMVSAEMIEREVRVNVKGRPSELYIRKE